jgi:hypothetical protein
MITKMPSNSSTRFLLYRRLRLRLGPTSYPPSWQGSMIPSDSRLLAGLEHKAGPDRRASRPGNIGTIVCAQKADQCTYIVSHDPCFTARRHPIP